MSNKKYKLIKPISQGCFMYVQPWDNVELIEVSEHNFELRENTKLYKTLNNPSGEFLFMFTDEEIKNITEEIKDDNCGDCSYFSHCKKVLPSLEVCSSFLLYENKKSIII